MLTDLRLSLQWAQKHAMKRMITFMHFLLAHPAIYVFDSDYEATMEDLDASLQRYLPCPRSLMAPETPIVDSSRVLRGPHQCYWKVSILRTIIS